MHLERKILSYIDANQLFTKESRLLVAVSGGVDSIVLLNVLHTHGFQCSVAHCNFQLRGEESMRDELLVESVAQKLGVRFFKTYFDTTLYAKEKHLSIEMAARELRYNWFEEVRTRESFDYVVVAHQANDSIETFFLNIARGTGLKGLRGISPKNGNIVRPMLTSTRDEIENYAVQHGLVYCIDSTNTDVHYKRNAIRQLVIPQMKKLNPSFVETMLQNMNHIANAYAIFDRYINSQVNSLIIRTYEGDKICIENLLSTLNYECILQGILTKYHFNSAQIKTISSSLKGKSGKSFISPSHRLIKNRDFLIITPILMSKSDDVYTIEEGTDSIDDPIHLNITYQEVPYSINRFTDIATLDYGKVAFPLKLRHWRRGDYFYPFGMSGKKKLSDFFTDKKFSLIDKENVWLLCDAEDRVVWVVGYRIDNRFAVTDLTKHLLIIEEIKDLIY